MTQPDRREPAEETRQGEVMISGVDTGPDNEERENLTPTLDHARFQPTMHPSQEPADEDG